MIWLGEKLVDQKNDKTGELSRPKTSCRYSKQHMVKIIGTQFRRDWMCHVSNSALVPFVELIKDEYKTQHLVIVPLPWTPSREELPHSLLSVLQ